MSELPESIPDNGVTPIEQQNPGCTEAAKAAWAAAVGLAKSGAFGDGTLRFRIEARGHYNPEHVAPEGWSKDYATTSVGQA